MLPYAGQGQRLPLRGPGGQFVARASTTPAPSDGGFGRSEEESGPMPGGVLDDDDDDFDDFVA